MNRVRTLMLASAMGAVAFATPASALNIVLKPDSTFSNSPNGAAALLGFQKAANYWNTVLTNNVTININVSFAALGTGILGSTGSSYDDVKVSQVYAALANNAKVANGGTALDQIAVANLRPLTAAGGLGYRMPDSITGVAGTGTGLGLETVARGSVYDNDDSYNNLYMYTNTASLKVLGLAGATNQATANSVDASITFSSNFAFDFNPTDGLTTGAYDFVSVATHEIGHALGFISGTDVYDYYANAGPGANPATGFKGNTDDWDTESVLTTLDLFRASANGGATGFNTDGKRYLQLDPNRNAGLSIDGVNMFNANNASVAETAFFSLGRYNGDGQQASHWKDGNGYFDINNCFIANRQVGIMDPTSGACQLGVVTANDLAAMDAIGYNTNVNVLTNGGYTFTSAQIFNLATVPEPATWMQLILGFGLIGGTVRSMRRRGTSLATA